MYSRPPNRDIRIPHNYGGSIFERNTSTPVQDLTRRRPSPQTPQAPPLTDFPPTPSQEETLQSALDNSEQSYDNNEDNAPTEQENSSSNKKSGSSLLSPIGALGTEEILLIALALIIFQNGKDPDLALILLALLFI